MIASGVGQSFLFVDDILEKPEGAETVILIVLFIVTTVLTFLYTTATTQTATGAQRYIFLALPILFAPLIISQPAGLGLYWIATNIWSLGQQVVVQRIMPMPTPPTPEERKAAQDAAAAPAAEEEEATMSDEPTSDESSPRSRPSGSRSMLDEIVDALDLDGEIVVDERDDEIAARIEGDELGAADRPPRPDDRRGPAALLPGRLPRPRRAQAGLGRRRRLPRAPPRDGRAPGRARRRAGARDRQGDRARADERRPSARSSTTVLKDRPGLETFSEGEEPDRCVIVAPLVGD